MSDRRHHHTNKRQPGDSRQHISNIAREQQIPRHRQRTPQAHRYPSHSDSSERSGSQTRDDRSSYPRSRSPLQGNRTSESQVTRRIYCEPETEKSPNTDRVFCSYCGDDLVCEETENETSRGYHQECISIHKPRCDRAAYKFRRISKNKHILRIAIHVRYLYGVVGKEPTKKEKRDSKAQELLNKVSALRNSFSGFLLIHLVGLNYDDHFTGAFDEFVDAKLQGLINDGSVFDDVYKKTKLSALGKGELDPFNDILVLYVEGSKCLTTSDYKTKLALDSAIIDTPALQVQNILQKRKYFEKKYHEINVRYAEELSSLQESRHVQIKHCCESSVDDELVLSALVKLRLLQYVSAFSKNKDGGSYLFGIGEVPQCRHGYTSQAHEVRPIPIDNPTLVETLIKKCISTTCLVCDYDGKEASSEDLVKVFFIEPRSRSAGKANYVIHISVRPVSGIVFYDKKGPVAYRVDTTTNTISRLTLSEWFKAFTESQGKGR